MLKHVHTYIHVRNVDCYVKPLDLLHVVIQHMCRNCGKGKVQGRGLETFY